MESRAVDQTTIQFRKLLVKGHSTQASSFPQINILEMLECATSCNFTVCSGVRKCLKSEGNVYFREATLV